MYHSICPDIAKAREAVFAAPVFCRKLAMSCENPTISRFSSIVGEDRFCIRVTGIDGESQYVGFDNKRGRLRA